MKCSLFVGNTDIPTELISVSTYSGKPDSLLKSIVYNNIDQFTELTYGNRIIYYLINENRSMPVHCFFFDSDGVSCTVGIPARIIREGKSDALTRDEALTYLDLEPIKLD